MADRETIIVDRGRNTGSVIVGIVVAIALAFIGYLVFFADGNGGQTVDIDVPAVSVDVVPDGQ